eukprot:GHVO01010125.1.p1 GENE.GHVO01010125.1~~GHVO01010125.1.p1  ORF type:complete len:163 (-),score=22.65 GHVO01010125.1:970-1458(-)
MSDWDSVVSEWTVGTGNCYAGALANGEDGLIYACAVDEGEPWSAVYCEDYSVEIEQEDGSKKKTQISEPTTILQAIQKGSAPNGLWMGGIKYKVISLEKEFEYGDYTFGTLLCARPKAGAHLVSTPGNSIVIVLYDEQKDQTAGNAKVCALAFAEYLAGEGY